MSPSPRRSGARTRSASALLAALALAGGFSACGDDDGGTATDPAATTSTPSPSDTPSETPSPSESPSEDPSPGGDAAPIRVEGSAGVTDAVLVDATEGGGSPSEMAFALDTDQAVADFVVGLQSGLPDEVAAAVEDLRAPGTTPYGAVVATGCEPPRSVAIDAGEAGFQVVPALPKSTVQCLAPVTYVVVFAAPDA
ncbi:hypothetical protein IEZ26_01180 [Nocardioides cavernae]|uniref:Lipoprotein n=1 Tax=Nocardioides cavernae TaxID=1921566 RepID=A0ABR8N4Y8_9ACTN|nr:hypothetical protein [Nocardioides cavernae]MBD3923218.1 hypothetical protein [Nocardioides cavernae]MBM7511861.1 hypothetical protein [Nocardioides cavernae]